MGKANIGKGPSDVGKTHFHPGYEHFAGATHIIVGRLSFHVGIFMWGNQKLGKDFFMSEKHSSLGKLSPCWKNNSVRVGKSTPSLGEWRSSCGEGCTLMWGMHTITWKTLSDGKAHLH